MSRILILAVAVALLAAPVYAAQSVSAELLQLPGDDAARATVTGKVVRVSLSAERLDSGVSDVRVYLTVEGSTLPVICPTDWVAVERPVDCNTVRPGIYVEARGVVHEDERGVGSVLILDPLLIQEAMPPAGMD